MDKVDSGVVKEKDACDASEEADQVRNHRRKLMMFGGVGAAVAATAMTASSPANAAPPNTETNHMQSFLTIEDMLADNNNIDELEIVYAGSWNANFPTSLPGMFMKLTFSGTGLSTSLADDGMVIAVNAGSSDDFYLRLLGENRSPDLALWKSVSGNWDSAFSNAVTYLNENQYLIDAVVGGLNSLTNALHISPGTYPFTNAALIERPSSGSSITALNDGISLIGRSPTDTILRFSQSSGLHIKGLDDEAEPGAWLFRLENLQIDGDVNTSTSVSYGLKLDRCSVVDINNCMIHNFAADETLQLVNTFNVKWEGGLIDGGDIVVGVQRNGGGVINQPWTNSNIQFYNTMIANGNSVGVLVDEFEKTMDNLRFDNVAFKDNGSGTDGNGVSFQCIQPTALNRVSNVAFKNCHFEKSTTVESHIDIRGAMGLTISSCLFINAETHINLDSVRGFSINGNRVMDDSPSGSKTGISIIDTQTYGTIGPNSFVPGITRLASASTNLVDDFVGYDNLV